MTCADELAAVQREIDQLRTRLAVVQSAIAAYRAATPSTQQGINNTTAASTATGPATRPATQPQEERRADNGELAQYAALMRDIADMERRLDKLEVR